MGTHGPPGSMFPRRLLQLALPLACCLKEQKEQKPQLQVLLFPMDISGSAMIPVTLVHTCKGMHRQALLSAAGCFFSAMLKPHGVK